MTGDQVPEPFIEDPPVLLVDHPDVEGHDQEEAAPKSLLGA